MNWEEYFIGFALHASSKSKDKTQVGAVLVGKNNEVLMTAYNGPPPGVADLPWRRERPQKYLFACHAETNIVAFAARAGVRTEGGTIYVTHMPCSHCARVLVQAGIKRVVHGAGETSMPQDEFQASKEIFFEARVSLRGAT